MERAEQRQRRRGSARLPQRFSSELVQTGILLGFAFGMALCAVQEAAYNHDWVWMSGFIIATVVMVGLYWWVASAWVKSII